jgi:peptide chain release factor 1
MEELEKTRQEYDQIIERLGDPGLISDLEKFEELSRRKSFLEKVLNKEKEIDELKARIEENRLLTNANDEPELASLANAEINQDQEKRKKLEEELKGILKGGKNSKRQSAIVEIRAGAGGEEAAIFASDLYQMYSKYAKEVGWQTKLLDSNQTGIGGFKEIIFEINPGTAKEELTDVWSNLKYEAGVHRVQRIPQTEKTGRIHTSTASVAILRKPAREEMKIRADELKIDFFRSSGAGGQNVNKRETAVRITHLPTGLSVASQAERSQLDNRENAMSILIAKILEQKEERDLALIGSERKAQIGWAKRAEKIKTYNFPQDRLTDHRVKKNWHHLTAIMEGGLGPVIGKLKELLEEN